MRKFRRLLLAAILLSAATSGPAQTAKPSVDDVLSGIGAEATRKIHSDICLPATGEEYVALGKNAILMVEATSAISTELPLRSVYIDHKGVRIRHQPVALLDKRESASSQTTQISFYMLPIQMMKRDAHLLADFVGDRKGFGFMSFTAKEGLDRGAPAFARLDEYDTPADPDPATIAAVLAREYPDHFR